MGAAGSIASALLVLSAAILPAPAALAGAGVWTTGGPRGGNINALAITPNGGSVYAATSHGGLMLSTNGGSSWSFRNGTLGNTIAADAVTIQTSTPTTLYMASGGTVYKSTNGGSSWAPANTGITGSVTSVTIDQSTPAILYASTDMAGIFKSTNGGTSWAPVNTGLPRNGSYYTQFFGVRVDPTTHTTIFAIGANGIYKSTNSGSSWTSSHTGIAFNDAVNALLINPAQHLLMLAAASSGVYKSTNGGSSWSLTPLSSSAALSLALRPSNPNVVYAGLSFGGIQISTNFGGSWAPSSTGLPSSSTVLALAVNPVTQTTVFAGLAYPYGVFKTTTGSWAAVNGGINQIFISSLAAIPGSTTTFLAGADQLGVQKTTNDGASFAASNSGLPTVYWPQGFDFFNAGYGVVTGYGATAFTANQGASWTQFTGSNAPTYGTAVQVDKTNKNHIDVMGFSGFTITTNGGASWITKNPNCFPLLTFAYDFAMQPNNGLVGLVATTNGVYRTTNDWTTCTKITGNLPSYTTGVTFDRVSPSKVIVFGYGASISTNGGASFTAMSALAGNYISDLFINPANDMNILAAVSGTGVKQSTNGGGSFATITNAGLVSTTEFTSVIKLGTTVAAGLYGNSVPVIVP